MGVADNFVNCSIVLSQHVTGKRRAKVAELICRFTYKLQFGFLDQRGKRLFFKRMFHSALTKDEWARLDGIRDLAPGDFRTVRQGLYYLGETVGNAERLSGLEHESTVKSKGCSGIGFSPAA